MDHGKKCNSTVCQNPNTQFVAHYKNKNNIKNNDNDM